jgi:hypothetical protein
MPSRRQLFAPSSDDTLACPRRCCCRQLGNQIQIQTTKLASRPSQKRAIQPNSKRIVHVTITSQTQNTDNRTPPDEMHASVLSRELAFCEWRTQRLASRQPQRPPHRDYSNQHNYSHVGASYRPPLRPSVGAVGAASQQIPTRGPNTNTDTTTPNDPLRDMMMMRESLLPGPGDTTTTNTTPSA